MRFYILLIVLISSICPVFAQNIPPASLDGISQHDLENFIATKSYSFNNVNLVDILEFFNSSGDYSFGQRQMMSEITHDSAYTWDWDAVANEWIFERKSIFFRNEALNNSVTYQYIWNGTAWENTYRITTTYGLPGNQTTVSEEWDGNEFVNYSKFILTNDTVKRESTNTYQRWQSNQWVDQFSTRITMNTHEQISHIISIVWNGSAWINSRQVIYIYDTAQVLQTVQTQDWINLEWLLTSYVTYTYNTNEVISTLYALEDPIGMLLNRREIRVLDTLGQLLTWNSQSFEENQWLDTWRRFFEYNSDGNETVFLEERYSDSEEWQNSNRTLTDYFTHGYRLNIVRQVWDSVWVGADSIHHYYTEIVTSSHGEADLWEDFRIYPNPAAGEVSFISSHDLNEPLRLRVYSTTGNLILELKEFNITEPLDVSGLSPGLYFIQFMNRTDQVVRWMVKQ